MSDYIEHNEAMPSLPPIHPGFVLKNDTLPDRNLTVVDLAAKMGVNRAHLSNVVNSKKPLTADMAVKLEDHLGVSADTLMILQVQYDLAQVRQEAQEPEHA